MPTIASEVMEEILEEENLGHITREAMRIIERNKRQKRLDQQAREWAMKDKAA